MKPLVSVVVAIYNSKKYLEQCLNSLINQTYLNIEVVLIDDGSTDGSAIVCDQYAASNKIIKVIHTKNQGASAARNRGILESCGEFVTFIDSDDYVSFNYIEKLIENLKLNDTDAVMAQERGVFEDKDGNIVKEVSYTNIPINDNVNEVSFLHFCKSKGFCDTRKLFKRQLLKDISFDNNLGWGEDFVFMYYMACKHPHKMTTEMEAIYYYRNQIEYPSINRWQNKKMNNIIKKLHSIYIYYKKQGKNIERTEFVGFYDSCFVSRYNYCIKKFSIFQLFLLIPYRFSYFNRIKSFKTFLYSFFPYFYRLLLKIKHYFRGQ